MSNTSIRRTALALATAMLAANAATAGVPVALRAERLVTVGQPLAGSVVSDVYPAHTDGDGRPGALVVLATGARVVWYDGAVIFDSSTVSSPVLTGGEEQIGLAAGNRFIYSPSADGQDAVYTHAGLLLSAGDPMPGVPNQFSSFNSRPAMLADGRAFWVGGFSDTPTGSTLGRVLLRATTTGTPQFEVLLRGGDLVGGVATTATGISFGAQTSDNGAHVAAPVTLASGNAANDAAIYLDGALGAREGDPATGGITGELWQNFAGVAVNDAGNWLMAGDTSGNTASDAFVAYNGTLRVREGDIIDGATITSNATVRAIGINNRNQALHFWTIAGATDRLVFFAPDASQLAQSRLLMRVGTPLDFDGNGTTDATVTDVFPTFTFHAGVALGEDGHAYLNVTYDAGGVAGEAIVKVAVDPPPFADGFEPLVVVR